MKARTTIVTAALMLAMPLVAENINGFENFVLSRGDFKSNPSSAIADFSSRTHTEDTREISDFSSRKPRGTFIILR